MDEKSSASDSPADDEKRVPFNTVPNAYNNADQGGQVQANHTKSYNDNSLRPPNLAQVRSNGSTWSQRSYAGADGYTHFNEDEEAERQPPAEEEAVPQETENKFEVTWDGDDDPMNPKSRTLARKWLIVLICASCSLCVTCASAMITSTYAQLEAEFGWLKQL